MTVNLRPAHDLREAAKSCNRAYGDDPPQNTAALESAALCYSRGSTALAARRATTFMQFRKLFRDYPGLTTAISVALLLVALGVVGYQLWTRRQPPPQGDPLLKQEHRTGPAQSQAGPARDVPACASATSSEVG